MCLDNFNLFTYSPDHTVGFPISWLVWSFLLLFTVFMAGSLVPKTSQVYGPDRNESNQTYYSETQTVNIKVDKQIMEHINTTVEQ